MEPVYEKLDSLIDSYIKEMTEDLMRLIEIPSITDDRPQVNKALMYTMGCGRRLGFDVTVLLDGEVGLIEMGEGTETLGILAHVDVVSEGDSEKWRTPPFQPVLKNGILYGRGTLDDKGPVVASLYAMKAVSELSDKLGKPLLKKVQLILGTREEKEWTDMDAYVRQFPLPDYGFTPDGEFPICNIEKGVATLTMFLPIGLDNIITRLEGGTASNVVPGKCLATVGGKDITIEGKAVHASSPEKGENAILKMAQTLLEMDLQESPFTEVVASMLLKLFKDAEGTALGVRSESEYYNGEFVHRNIFTPTMIDVTEDGTKIVFDIRYAYGTNFNEILNVFNELALSLGGRVDFYQDLPPVYVSSKKAFLRVLAGAYERITGLKNEFVLAYGGSYAKAMPNIVSWGPIFPGEPDTCHEENEFITIDSLVKNAKIFASAIWDIVLSERSFK